jgi:hypothetical protein
MEASKLEWKYKSKIIYVYFVSVFAFWHGSAVVFALLVTKHAFPNHQPFRAQTYECVCVCVCVTSVSAFQTAHAVQLFVCNGHKNMKG